MTLINKPTGEQLLIRLIHWIMHLKVDTHNLITKTHTVKAGTFPVQIYQEHPQGLYVERDFVGHPIHKHWQAHILPQQHLQICRFTPHKGEPQWKYYIDMVEVRREGHIWRVQDLYLDLVITPQSQLEVLDTDELLEATREGLISLEQLALATQTAHQLINQLSQHHNDLDALLKAKGLDLQWNWQTA